MTISRSTTLLVLILVLTCGHARASDVSTWDDHQLRSLVASTLDDGEVVEVRGHDLHRCGSVTGVVLGRFRETETTYLRFFPVFQRDGKPRFGTVVDAGGADRAMVAGVLDLEAATSLSLDLDWTRATVPEPSAATTRPVLVIVVENRLTDGSELVRALFYDVRDPEAVVQLGDINIGSRHPEAPLAPGVPVQHTVGAQADGLSIVPGADGPRVELRETDLPSSHTGCLPEQRVRVFTLQDHRLVERPELSTGGGCP